MISPVGSVIVCGDYKGNLKKICKVLNSFMCKLDFGEFVAEGQQISVNSHHIDNPSIYFDRLTVKLPNGETICVDDINDERLDESEDIHCDAVPLDVISQRISPLLIKGTLELAAVAYGGNVHAFFQRLVIGHDGFVERERRYFNSFERNRCSEYEIERFNPDGVNVAA